MRERVCKNCGGREYKVVGQNMVKCKFCGTLYVDELGSKEEEVLLVGAYEILRAFDFEKAVEEFDKILTLFPLSFEAYFGKALAKNHIVLYNNRRGIKKNPKFFGEIKSISEDEDFLKALELSPEESKKGFEEISNKIDSILRKYEKIKEQAFDVILCGATEEQALNLKSNLEYNVYLPPQKEQEEFDYLALEKSKAFLLFLDEYDLDDKILCDRYLYLSKIRQKAKSSFIIIKSKDQTLPKEFKFCKSVVDSDSISFLQDLKSMLKEQMSKTVMQKAKIENIKVEKVAPQKKEYVDLDTISPNELGSYSVENLELDDKAKLKWIFLSLKNGDFATADNLIGEELEKNQYNAEVLFAQALSKRKLKNKEDFFSKISNFQNKEEIENILRYSNKSFAEDFVDQFEILIESLDSEEYYNKYLLFLASYNSPNREEFIKKAENKATETLNEELIEKVEKCFAKDEVERFINFYFVLAQNFDGKKSEEYYKKILELDAGHKESNLAQILRKFETNEQKLEYQNKDELENILKYFDEETQSNFLSAIISRIMQAAYIDLNQMEKQLDFYLSYVPVDKRNDILKTVYTKFLNMGFFKQAEKYLSIILSKEKSVNLYWDLIKIKTHCKSDSEIISSNIKISQMPEWMTLLSLGDDKDVEYFAGIVSKANLFSGKRKEFKEDMLDQKTLISKLKDFVARNQNILLSAQKQDGFSSVKGVEYFKLQLRPFEKYIEMAENVKNFDEYCELYDKLCLRLDALSLSLDSSISLIDLENKNGGMKEYKTSKDTVEKHDKKIKSIKNDLFLKRFIFIFIELIPLLFGTLLFVTSLFAPKQTYLYFSQDFLIGTALVSIVIALANFVYYLIKSKKTLKKTKIALILLSILGFFNLILSGLCLSSVAMPIEITNSDNIYKLMSNARYSNFVLKEDITLKNWKAVNFSGNFDGKGHQITLVNSKDGFINTLKGDVKNMYIILEDAEIENFSVFGVVAKNSEGNIQNVTLEGDLKLELTENSVFGGFVGTWNGGTIKSSTNLLNVEINLNGCDLVYGGFAGKVLSGNKNSNFTKNIDTSIAKIDCKNAKTVTVGGSIGQLEQRKNFNFSENVGKVDLSVSGNCEVSHIGGFVGYGKTESENNYTTGQIDVNSLVGDVSVGGLYGTFDNVVERVTHSYSIVQILGSQKKIGALIGTLKGNIEFCFGVEREIFGVASYTWAGQRNCLILISSRYDNSLGFDENIWKIEEYEYPRLKWEV